MHFSHHHFTTFSLKILYCVTSIFVQSANGIYTAADRAAINNMSESIPKADIAAMDNTGYNKGGNDNPFTGVHMDFGPLIDTDKKIADLVGTGFYANCCTDCCPCEFKFTDGNAIKKTSSAMPHTVEIGLKKPDGSYYASANELCDALVKTSDLKNIDHVKYRYKTIFRYSYSNEWQCE